MITLLIFCLLLKKGDRSLACKATKTLGFLRRNVALAPRYTKKGVCKTLDSPQLEYAAPIYLASLSAYHDTETEMVEKGRGQQPGGHGCCRRWRNQSSVGER